MVISLFGFVLRRSAPSWAAQGGVPPSDRSNWASKPGLRWHWKRALWLLILRRGGCCLGSDRLEGAGHGLNRSFHAGRFPMALHHPRGIVVGQPYMAFGILPNQGLQRQVNANGLCRLHQRCAAFRAAEDQEVRGTQGHTNLGGAGGMVDMSEDRHALRFDGSLEPLHGLFRSVAALDCDQSVSIHGFRSNRYQ